MKTLHFDCFAGISGDMALGAFVDLGVDPDQLRAELAKLGLTGWNLKFHRDQRGGIGGTHAVVDLGEQTDHIAHDDDHEHESDHDHESDHQHEHGHDHDHHHGAGHVHRAWKDIRALIEVSGISAGAKKRALDIFSRIAEAEAQVHGKPVEEIAFHEVGALDSIIDIVGAAICLDMLRPDRITCGEIELGGGTVTCAHGVLPVPAPATALLCRGLPVKTGGFNKEMTTPTGAAILASQVDEFIDTARYRELKSGYGIGTRKMDKPNLLRVSWREEGAPGAASSHAASFDDAASTASGAALPGGLRSEELVLLEANIDDMSGEELGFLMECLFEAGALDVTLSPCVMKKSRPGTVVSALGSGEKLEGLRRTLIQRSSTIGFREIPVRRLSLAREEGRLSGGFGEARTKTVFYEQKPLRFKAEYEDRARIARERGISLDAADKLISLEGV
jgi:uncharacterized protein (TIGR00299 family) protein